MNDELQLEKNHLKDVVEKLNNAKDFMNRSLETLGVATLERLTELRENPEMGMDFMLLLEQLHEKNESFNLKDKYKRLEELAYLIENPYFARIDLFDSENNFKNEIRIGKFGYTENMPVVTDWRTKIASVYYKYRYPQKNISYETPDGKVSADLTLKRTYEIDNGQLIKLYNNDLQLDENEIIADKIKKRTGGVLEDIVETIQQSQMDIIEADPRQVCIVQGCVGSGKSTVAIHKLSHIFFNFPSYIRPEKSILIAKNQILVGYLSTLFPKLGIFDINFKTLRDLMVNVIFREEIKLTYDLDLDEDTSKYDMNWFKDFDREIMSLHQEFEKEMNAIFTDPEFESYGGTKYSREYTPVENINEILLELNEELAMQNESYKEDPKSIRGMLHKQNMGIIRKLIKKLQLKKAEVKEKYLPQLVKDMGLNVNSRLTYSEVLLYIYAYSRIIGYKKSEIYEYCVVDEGQDFSILEYLFLDKLVLRGRFGIFGDLNQALENDSITQWDEIIKIIQGAGTANVFKLTTNYRSTEPIISLAKNILTPYTDEYLPQSINRSGSVPEIKTFNNTEEMLSDFKQSILPEAKDIQKSIGIICFGNELEHKVTDILKTLDLPEDKVIKLNKAQKIFYIPRGVYIMNFEDCKGLEFAKVYVLGLNLDRVSNYPEAKRAYVAVTRAMNELNVFGLK